MNWNATNLPDELAQFKQYCNLIFEGRFSKRTDKEKTSYILLWIGKTGVDTYNSWTWTNDEEKSKPLKIWERYELHIAPKTNSRLARYQLQQFRQKSEETLDDFMARCRNQANKCKFRDSQEIEDRLIEQLIIGTKHKRVQERLFEKGDTLTLDIAIDLARTHEATLKNVEQLGLASSTDTDGQNQKVDIVKVQKQRYPQAATCRFCGGNKHRREKCPANGTRCSFCSKPNHWEVVCMQKGKSQQGRSRANTRESGNRYKQYSRSQSRHRYQTKQRQKNKQRQVNYVDEDPDRGEELEDDFESLTFGSITISNVEAYKDDIQNEAFVTLDVKLPHMPDRNTRLRAKVDTGAQGNIMPLRVYRQMFPRNMDDSELPKPNTLQFSKTLLTAYGGTPNPHYGICTVTCHLANKTTKVPFYITKVDGPAIIGLSSSKELGLVSLNYVIQTDRTEAAKEVKTIHNKKDLIQQYPECFDGIGKFQGQYHISIDPTVPAAIHPPRRIPLALKDRIKLS